ncbi:hypothetical protein SPTER_27280 [Sporomusa termitida]|uniref:Uncharacterized protein n=1 Tax=Sporomusa termitida TaxID=2377 RepID=A0A517DVF7_9FIRM|nr:hypothetical protein SPTER_27280 [Sporomusa termitida]
MVTKHLWEPHIDAAEDFRHSVAGPLYANKSRLFTNENPVFLISERACPALFMLEMELYIPVAGAGTFGLNGITGVDGVGRVIGEPLIGRVPV